MSKDHINNLALVLVYCLLALAPGLTNGQQNSVIGEWTPYVSYLYPNEITFKDPWIIAVTKGGYFAHDLYTDEQNAYTTTDGLSEINPTTVFHDQNSGKVFIGFANGMINFFEEPGSLDYISDIERSDLFTIKRINQFYEYDGLLYIATGFGIVIYDPIARETVNTISKIADNPSGQEVYSITIWDNQLWATMGAQGIYSADMDAFNIALPDEWSQDTLVADTFNLPKPDCYRLAQFDNRLYAMVDTVVFRRDLNNWELSPLGVANYRYMIAVDGALLVNSVRNCYVMTPGDLIDTIYYAGYQNCSYKANDAIIIGDELYGVQIYENNKRTPIAPPGPANNFVSQIVAGPGELYVAPSGRSGSAQVTEKSGIFYYNSQTGWDIITRVNGLSDYVWYGFNNAHYDRNSGIAYIGSHSKGVVALKGGDTVATYHGFNSGFTGFSETDVRVSALTTDTYGNLWVSLTITDGNKVLNVKTPDDEWYSFGISGLVPKHILVDNYGNKWITNNNGGVVVFNENGTMDYPFDDNIRTFTSGANKGGLESGTVNCITKDLEGEIWIGTDDGVSVFYDQWGVFESSFPDASCPVYIDQCLMNSQSVNTIEVDGANRKWIGTDNGIFLISADGQDQIHHFTTDNSQLFDNRINDLAIDPQSGEVFIGTESGLMSYMGDAIEEYENAEEVYAFPNPVFTDYQGVVTIRGVGYESIVKITNSAGWMVKEIVSNGGQAVWDMTDQWGNRVKSGIYLALIADDEADKKGLAQIAVIER